MSKQPLLSQEEKKHIAYLYTTKQATQQGLAEMYMVSRKTIQRALLEMDVVKYKFKAPRVVTEEEADVLHTTKVLGLNARTLRQLVNSHQKTETQQVLQFLTSLDKSAFADLVSVAGHQRLKQQASKLSEDYQQQRAANE